jgi:hypothetical protein
MHLGARSSRGPWGLLPVPYGGDVAGTGGGLGGRWGTGEAPGRCPAAPACAAPPDRWLTNLQKGAIVKPSLPRRSTTLTSPSLFDYTTP